MTNRHEVPQVGQTWISLGGRNLHRILAVRGDSVDVQRIGFVINSAEYRLAPESQSVFTFKLDLFGRRPCFRKVSGNPIAYDAYMAGRPTELPAVSR